MLWLAPSLVSLLGSVSVALLVYRAGRAQSRVQTTLELHREYFCTEFALVRSQADRFIRFNHDKDWSLEPSAFPDPERAIQSLQQIIRFFHRVAVLRQVGQLNEKLLFSLFAREAGYWAAFIFWPMKDRTGWNTKSSVLDLLDYLKDRTRGGAFAAGVDAGRDRRENGSILVKGAKGEIIKLERDQAIERGLLPAKAPAAAPE